MPHFPLRFYADSRLAPERRNGSNPMERNLGTLTKAKRKKKKATNFAHWKKCYIFAVRFQKSPFN